MNQDLSYKFVYSERCNMCASPASEHRILGKRLNRPQGRNPKHKTGITTTVCKCTRCGLIYSNPQPVPFDIQDHYGVQPEQYWKQNYFVPDDHYFESEIERLRKLMNVEKGMKSLDVGAGVGKAMVALNKAGFDAFGFEPSKQFYERARARMNISPDRIKLGMIETMDYPENYFDFISFAAVLEHLYDPAASITKATKWLKPNGMIYIEVPSSDWLIHKFINFFYWLIRTDYVANISPMHEPYHLYEFGLHSFQEHAKLTNYEIAFYEYHVCETYMPKIPDYLLKPLMKWTNTGMQLCVWLRKK